MALRGTVTRLDRLLASLSYLFTLYSSLGCALMWVVHLFVEDKKSPLRSIILHLYPFLRITFSGWYDAFVSVIVWFGLYIFVVRNMAIQDFVRFHMMQSLSLLAVGSLVGSSLFWWWLQLGLNLALIPNSFIILGFIILVGLMVLISIATAIASAYSIFCAIMGKYGAIPVVSKAVKSHLRL